MVSLNFLVLAPLATGPVFFPLKCNNTVKIAEKDCTYVLILVIRVSSLGI